VLYVGSRWILAWLGLKYDKWHLRNALIQVLQQVQKPISLLHPSGIKGILRNDLKTWRHSISSFVLLRPFRHSEFCEFSLPILYKDQNNFSCSIWNWNPFLNMSQLKYGNAASKRMYAGSASYLRGMFGWVSVCGGN